MSHRVLLVGGGHAHLHVIHQAERLRAAHCEPVLIEPGDFWYSGRATGMLGGRFDAEDDRVDIDALSRARGVVRHRARACGLQPEQQRLWLDDGQALSYDAVSFNVGSTVAAAFEGAEAAWPVKPIDGLWPLRRRLVEAFEAGERPTIAVVGGGATGCEIAANLAALARRHRVNTPITLVHGGQRLAPMLPAAASRRLAEHLASRGISLRLGARVAAYRDAVLALDAGPCAAADIAADIVVRATGLQAPGWLGGLGLAFDDGLVVDDRLTSVDDPRVFAVGDCANLRGHALPRLGVFGVRQAATLVANLCAAAGAGEAQRYRPQRRWLSILDLGDGSALAARGRLWWHGRASRWLKHRLDRDFLAQYRA